MRTLYLHVGVHRTGTTSTQRFMKDNYATLRKKGVLYPFGVKRHDGLINRILGGESDVTLVALDLEQRADSHSVPIHSVVLSDEDISLIEDFSIFAPFRDVFDVKVVVSLRRQDLWLESWYLQNIKWQWNPTLAHLTFEEFYPRRAEFFWIDYAARFAHFEDVFGPGCVVAGVFERADMPEGPIQSFLNMIGISDLNGFGPFLHRNSSLTPMMSEYMRLLPMDTMNYRERAAVEAACIEVDETLVTNGSKLLMTRVQREEVLAEYASSNAHTAQTYIGRKVLFRDPLPAATEVLANIDLPKDPTVLNATFTGPILNSLAASLIKDRIALETLQGKSKPKSGIRVHKASARG